MITTTDINITLRKATRHTLSDTEYSVSFHDGIETIRDIWDEVGRENIFLGSDFYRALEASPPSGVTFVYVILYRKEIPVGVLYFQIKRILLDESLRLERKATDTFFDSIFNKIKCFFARQIRATTLIGGNLTLTGTYGNSIPNITNDERWNIITQTTELLSNILKDKGTNVFGVLHKDYYKKGLPSETPKGYTHFEVQPNMILRISEHWTSFEEYTAAMKSKYRVRVRRARKKASHIQRRMLTLDELAQYQTRISELYRMVSDGAGFNLFVLPEDYFYSLKKHLGAAMKVIGYFDGERMVGFCTCIEKGDVLDAHFLGYDFEENKKSQLYLNMLYDLVDQAITNQKERLTMSRTALEIKSSVGAEGHPMHLYGKINNRLLNFILPKALGYFMPVANWQPREIFKSVR